MVVVGALVGMAGGGPGAGFPVLAGRVLFRGSTEEALGGVAGGGLLEETWDGSVAIPGGGGGLGSPL